MAAILKSITFLKKKIIHIRYKYKTWRDTKLVNLNKSR